MKRISLKFCLIALILATAFLFRTSLNPVTKGNKYYILQKWEEAERRHLTAQGTGLILISSIIILEIYISRRDYDKAISYFKRLWRGRRGFLRVIIISALPMLKGGFSMRAIYYYEKARGLRPDDEDLRG